MKIFVLCAVTALVIMGCGFVAGLLIQQTNWGWLFALGSLINSAACIKNAGSIIEDWENER